MNMMLVISIVIISIILVLGLVENNAFCDAVGG